MGVTGKQLQNKLTMTEPRKDVTIKIYPQKIRNKAKIMATSLGNPFVNMVPPMCDTSDPLNFRQAVVKRVARETPKILNPREFRDITRNFIHTFAPVPVSEWIEFEKSWNGIEYWLSRNGTYTLARKDEIRKAKKTKIK